MPTSVPNFNFLAPLVTEIWRGSQNKNWELLIFSQTPSSGQIFTGSHSTYKCLPNFNFLARLVSEIWGGSQNRKVGAPDFPRRPLADKFLYRAIVRVNAYKCAKFQLSSSISYEDIYRGLKLKIGGCWSPQTPPISQIITCSHSTCKWLSPYQISTL